MAHTIAQQGGSRAAAAAVTVKTVLRNAPPGTTVAQAQAVVNAVKDSFVHALHVGVFVAACFAVLASIVSVVFVRSHVQEEPGQRELSDVA